MYDQTFKNIDNSLRKDDGCATELDYTEQTSWILFLKYLNDFEEEQKRSAQLSNQEHSYLLEKEYRWDVWAAAKKEDGTRDLNKAITGNFFWSLSLKNSFLI